MQFTLYIETSNLEETNLFIDDFISNAMRHNVAMSVEDIEKYRKIDEMYILSLVVNQDSLNNVNKFLCMIASKWLEFPDEYLASKMLEDCEVYIKNLNMIIAHR